MENRNANYSSFVLHRNYGQTKLLRTELPTYAQFWMHTLVFVQTYQFQNFRYAEEFLVRPLRLCNTV